MQRMLTATLILFAMTFIPACGGGDDHAGHDHDAEHNAFAAVSKAVCVLSPTTGSDLQGVSGIVTLTQTKDGLLVEANVTGLKPDSKHGFHVHMWGDISDAATGKATGGHYDPEGNDEHALPEKEEHDGHSHMVTGKHAGDLGNLQADAEGNASYSENFENITLTGKNAVLGRGMIVHIKADDGGQPTGNAGARVAQGVIGIADPDLTEVE